MSSNPHSSAPPQIPGYPIPSDAATELKRLVAELLERDNIRFPGAQPISFSREHVAELQRSEYFMFEKTDGIRCLMYLSWRDNNGIEPLTLLIDRKNNYYDVTPPLRFPYFQHPDNAEEFLFGTILDGELVNDKYPEGSRLIYYVFDCLAIDGQNMTGRTLDKRLGYMQEKLFKPWERHLAKTRQQAPREPFLVKLKPSFTAYHINDMFDNIMPALKHGNDGLIFTCKNTRYEFGTDRHILKWKPPHENTIDFKLRLGDFPMYDPEDGEEGLVPDYDAMPTRFHLLVNYGRNDYRPFSSPLEVTEEEWNMLKSLNQRLDGRIIECYRSPSGVWKFKKDDDGTPRWRDDKADANHISTVESVLESIQDPVTESDLRTAESRIHEAVKRLRREEEEDRRRGQHEQMEISKKRKFSEANGMGHG